MLRIADDLRARPADEQLWTAISHSIAGQFESPVQKASDANRWAERVRFLFTQPAIHGEVLKANEAAQGELANAIAQRTGAKHTNRLYPQLMAAVVIAVVGVVGERWMRDGPSGSIVPLLQGAFDLVAAGFKEDRTPPGKNKRLRNN